MANAANGDKNTAARLRERSIKGARDTEQRDGEDAGVGDEMDSVMEEDVTETPEADAALVASDAGGTAIASYGERAMAERAAAPSWVASNPFTQFLYESYQELRKVTWPTSQQAWNMTLVVIGMSLFIAVLLALFDYGLAQALKYLVTLAK